MTAEPVSVADVPLRRKAGTRLRKAALFKQLGPGLITGAADDDPSGIATYSQAGAQFGFNMLWTMALTYPLMTAVQLVSAQMGRVTGCGLAKNIGDLFPKPLVLGFVGLLFIANTITSVPTLPRWVPLLSWLSADRHIFTRSFLRSPRWPFRCLSPTSSTPATSNG